MELVDQASANSHPLEVLKSLYVLWFIGILKENSSTREVTETEKTATGKNNKM